MVLWTIAGDGSTEPNIYLRNAQMQTSPISRTKPRIPKGYPGLLHALKHNNTNDSLSKQLASLAISNLPL